MILLLTACTPQKKQELAETTSYPTEAVFNHLSIALNESLPYTDANNKTYQAIAVTLSNTGKDSITLTKAFSTIAVLNEQGQDITWQIDWQTNDEHGINLATLKKLKPQQSVTGHIYYHYKETAPTAILLKNGKKSSHLQLPVTPTIPVEASKRKALTDSDVEAKVQVIRTWFNHIESNATANQMNVTHSTATTIYESEVYRKLTYTYNEMTYHFYYMNNELFFVYSYPNANSVDFESRYYFNQGHLIRWIRSNGETINEANGLQQPSYLQEEANILYLQQKLP